MMHYSFWLQDLHGYLAARLSHSPSSNNYYEIGLGANTNIMVCCVGVKIPPCTKTSYISTWALTQLVKGLEMSEGSI